MKKMRMFLLLAVSAFGLISVGCGAGDETPIPVSSATAVSSASTAVSLTPFTTAWNYTIMDGVTKCTTVPTVTDASVAFTVDSANDQVMFLKVNPTAADITMTVKFINTTQLTGKGIRLFARSLFAKSSAGVNELTCGSLMCAVTPSVVKLYKRLSGASSAQLTVGAAADTTLDQLNSPVTDSTTEHTIVFTITGTKLTVSIDGGTALAESCTETTLQAAGYTGVICEKGAGITVTSVTVQ